MNLCLMIHDNSNRFMHPAKTDFFEWWLDTCIELIDQNKPTFWIVSDCGRSCLWRWEMAVINSRCSLACSCHGNSNIPLLVWCGLMRGCFKGALTRMQSFLRQTLMFSNRLSSSSRGRKRLMVNEHIFEV